MSKYHISRRLQFIIQFIHDKKQASKEDILEFLADKDFNISSRTLERDFEKIKADFGIELTYSKNNNGYYIDEEKSVKVESFFRFLELVSLADVFADGLKNNNKTLEYVQFDDSSHLKGIDNLETILMAIKQERDLEFTHYSFHYNTYKQKIVTPIIIKEYINRWYLVGVPKGENDIRTFGIERITNINLGELSVINRSSYVQQTHRFEKIIGLMYSNKSPEHIVLKVTHLHLKYLESLPLHPSQKTLPHPDDGFAVVTYNLVPNYEFIIEILKMSIETEVLEPQWLRDRIKKEVEQIYNKYKD
ncbi:helix-turn-helix transcriptional regulator [Mangrovimonas cancribranchiae]|uniref:WYL domain-containing protein n=1 Tax=Mangrovimonas cancribranchiae TaxID=3080055 RepID=A0AAU6P991_9FLAO